MYKQLEIQQYLLYTITQVHNLVKTIIQAILYIKRKHYSFSHDFFSFWSNDPPPPIFSTVKGLLSNVSAGDDIFPMLQEETEKTSTFLGVTFSGLGRNLVNLTE